MKAFYKSFGIITNIVTLVIVVCILFAVGTLFIPTCFGTKPYIVLSGSMEPVIHTGSLVYISNTDEELQNGDVVAYEAGDGMAVVHRIIGYGTNGYITKGDANDVADMNEVMQSQIIGKYVFTVPNVGYILAAIRSHVFHLGFISMPAIIPIAVGVILLLNVSEYVIGLWVSDN